MQAIPKTWNLDPLDPRAPSAGVWEAMSGEERAAVYAMLPEDPYPLCNLMSEGDAHRKTATSAGDALDDWFRRRRRRAYVGRNLTVYYPGERAFAPDVFVALDAEPGERNSWLVSREGRGVDVVIEIHNLGERMKDVGRNVDWYARLGIPEYFVYEIPRNRFSGWRLCEVGARYERLMPQHGHYRSDVLDLEIGAEGGRVRFYAAGAVLPDREDLIDRLTAAVDSAMARAEEEGRRAEEEGRRAEEEGRRAGDAARHAEEEARRAERLQQRLDEALAELRRLRGEADPPSRQ